MNENPRRAGGLKPEPTQPRPDVTPGGTIDRREAIALQFAVILSDHMGAEAAAECGFLYADAFIAEAKRQREAKP